MFWCTLGVSCVFVLHNAKSNCVVSCVLGVLVICSLKTTQKSNCVVSCVLYIAVVDLLNLSGLKIVVIERGL